MSIKCNAKQDLTASAGESNREPLLYNRRDFIKAGASGAVSVTGGAMFAGNVLENPGRKGRKRVLAYSPPYGQHYLMDIETVNFMHRCGIDVLKLILSNSIAAYGYPYSPYPPIWSDDFTYHFDVVDRQIADLVAQNPDVRFIAMIDLNSPPFIVTRYHLDSFTNLLECYLTPRWNELMVGYQKALLEYLERKYADRICGYYIACGRTQEWFDHTLDRITEARLKHYDAWCREMGLQRLPAPGEADFEETPVSERANQWRRYCNALVGKCFSEYLDRAKKLIRPGIPIYAVYGNIHQFRTHGHIEAERILPKATYDCYIGPSCNSNGVMGGASGFQAALAMLERYGIGYLHSCDRITSTVRQPAPGVKMPPRLQAVQMRNAAEDVACLKREFSLALLHGFSLWFFNLWGFAYTGKEVRDLFMRIGELWRRYADEPSRSDAETLLVFDTDSTYALGGFGALQRKSPHPLYPVRTILLPEAGIPFVTATFDDLRHLDLAPYKLVVFNNLIVMDEEKKRVLQEKVCAGGRVAYGIPGGKEKWTAKDLRQAGKKAGLHFFTEDSDLKVWSSERFISAHTKNGGTKSLKLKRKAARVVELFSGKEVARNCQAFTDAFAAPDTKLYLIES